MKVTGKPVLRKSKSEAGTLLEEKIFNCAKPVSKVACSRPHIPNKETVKAIRESQEGKLKRYSNKEEFFADLGL